MASVFRVCGPHAMVSCRFLSQSDVVMGGSGAPVTDEQIQARADRVTCVGLRGNAIAAPLRPPPG